MLVVFQADAGAADAGPVALPPAGSRDAPADPWAPAAVPRRSCSCSGGGRGRRAGKRWRRRGRWPAGAAPVAGAGEPGVWRGIGGRSCRTAGGGRCGSSRRRHCAARTATGQAMSGWWVRARLGSVVGEGDGAGWVRYPGRVGLPVPGSGESEGSGFGRRTTDATASSKGTPASTDVVAARRWWCPEPERGTQHGMQEHLRKGPVPLRAPLLPCRAEDPHGNQSAFEFLRTSD